ncbi:unnamed protein product [Lota lota]
MGFERFLSECSACEAPGNPQCFRRNSHESTYICEWGRSAAASNVTYDLLINTTEPFYFWLTRPGLQTNQVNLRDELLIKGRSVYIVVTAHMGNASCTSNITTVVLSTVVKFPAPQKMTASWSNHSLTLTWSGQKEPASVDVVVRSLENKTHTWRHVSDHYNICFPINTGYNNSVLVKDLDRQMAYQVQVRQRSTQVDNSLWSEWSSTLTVPAEIQTLDFELKNTTVVDRGTRQLLFTWKVPPAARVGGVNYTLTVPQRCCMCADKTKDCDQITVNSTNYSISVTNSAVNFSIRATNMAGSFSPGYVNVPANPAQDLKACEKKLKTKVPHNVCVEWYEFKEGGAQPHAVTTFTGKKKIRWNSKWCSLMMKKFVRYVYLEYQCVKKIPKTVEMCLGYRKQHVPRREPLSFSGTETESSVDLSWLSIPLEDQRGFITHYSLCHTKHNRLPDQEPSKEECRNLTGSETTFRLENLQPESRYNISLAGVTSKGSGPLAFLIINTFPPKETPGGNLPVWISLGLLVTFFGASILCTLLVKRLKSKILPPIPEPIILFPALNRAANQDELEQRESMDEVSVHQPVLEGKHHWFEDLEEDMDGANTVLATDEDQTQKGSRDSFESPGDQEEVLYRNGFVFDMKAEELKHIDIVKVSQTVH